jgi:hypothetical protein
MIVNSMMIVILMVTWSRELTIPTITNYHDSKKHDDSQSDSYM